MVDLVYLVQVELVDSDRSRSAVLTLVNTLPSSSLFHVDEQPIGPSRVDQSCSLELVSIPLPGIPTSKELKGVLQYQSLVGDGGSLDLAHRLLLLMSRKANLQSR